MEIFDWLFQITTQKEILAAVREHGPLVIAIFVAGYFLFPLMLKKTLLNGGGEAVRMIMKSENLEQEDRLRLILKEEMTDYREIVRNDIATAKLEVRTEMIDRTDSFKLHK